MSISNFMPNDLLFSKHFYYGLSRIKRKKITFKSLHMGMLLRNINLSPAKKRFTIIYLRNVIKMRTLPNSKYIVNIFTMLFLPIYQQGVKLLLFINDWQEILKKRIWTNHFLIVILPIETSMWRYYTLQDL